MMRSCTQLLPIAVVFFALIIAAPVSSAAAAAAEALDTSKLPRVTSSKEVYASPQSTIFTTMEPVAATAETVAKALVSGGWQQYVAPFTDMSGNPNLAAMKFKNAGQGLSVFVALAPAQNNATSVSYIALALANDLPFPKDATDIQFDPNKPHLNCVTTGSVDATMDFFSSDLTSRGWSPWNVKDAVKSTRATVKTEKGAYAYFVHDTKPPLLLVVERGEASTSKVTLEAVPAETVVAAFKRSKENDPKPAEPATVAVKSKDKMDSLADDILKLANEAINEAKSGKKKSPPSAAKVSGDAAAALDLLERNTAPLPVPSTANDVVFEGDDGLVKYKTPSSVTQVAAFYRSAMKPLGWKEQHSVINNDNMVVLSFAKAQNDVSITIMRMGQAVNVSATSSSFITRDKTARADAAGDPASDSKPDAEQALEAGDSHGLPVPKSSTLTVGETPPFRTGVDANVPARLDAVLAFYRHELGIKDWKEETSKAVIKADSADLAYTTAEGPAVLKLGRKNGETTVHLVVRKDAEAKKSGLMAKPGQTKVLIGNMTEQEAVITINGRTIKVAAGAGAKAPDGPYLELGPGKYKYSSKAGGKPAKNDDLVIGADEIWGLMIGPGGSLPMQLY